MTQAPSAHVTVFDFGRGPRADEVDTGNGVFPFIRCGMNHSRRFYRRDSLFNMRASARFGGLGNPAVDLIKRADALLDISGGDSFSDIYGDKRFQATSQPKLLALQVGTPLVLLPQTYGPFDAPRNLETARRIVRQATMSWSRDPRNFDTLKDLLGENFDAKRHGSGVDVAFSLPRTRPREVPAAVLNWIEGERPDPVLGFNVSGLIYNQSAEASKQFGFRGDYREMILKILRRFLGESNARLLLVPPRACQAGPLRVRHTGMPAGRRRA